MMYYLSVLTLFLVYFIEPGVMQDLIIRPVGKISIPLNQMNAANFTCECILGIGCSPPFWSLVNHEGVTITTMENSNDEDSFAERGITYSSSSTEAFITIPATVENNDTMISCGAFLSGTEFSDPAELIVIGPPLPPDPVLAINSSSQLDIYWEVPYSNEQYPVESYNILLVNTSSTESDVLSNAQMYNETSFVHDFDGDVEYCQILTVNVTAVSALGSSLPGSAAMGFPIAPHQFNDIDVDVTFLRNGTPMASITFQAPLICDYQRANYVLTIEDTTDPNVVVEPIQSTYTGSDRNIMEVVMLIIDHNYTLFISVVENHFKIEVSKSKNFTTLFRHGASGHSRHELAVYIGVPVGILVFLLLTAIIIVAILVVSIVRKKKEWRLSRGGGNDVRASQASVYETINDYQIQQEVKPKIHLSPQQQEYLWKVQHCQHGGREPQPSMDDSYQAMMSSSATTRSEAVTTNFTYPPFAAGNQQQSSRVGNAYTQQPCPAAAGSSASPVFDYITVTHTAQLSPTMRIMVQDGGVTFLEDEYTEMSQAGTLTSQQSNRAVGTATLTQQEQSQGQSQGASDASGNAALPMYSVVNKGEKSKPQTMTTEC